MCRRSYGWHMWQRLVRRNDCSSRGIDLLRAGQMHPAMRVSRPLRMVSNPVSWKLHAHLKSSSQKMIKSWHAFATWTTSSWRMRSQQLLQSTCRGVRERRSSIAPTPSVLLPYIPEVAMVSKGHSCCLRSWQAACQMESDRSCNLF